MVNITYPSERLPFPVQDNFNQKLSNSFVRTKMDDGQSRIDRIYNSQPERISLTWRLTWEQLSYWEAWVEYDLDGGSAWFDIQISPLLPVDSYHMVSDPNYTYDDDGEWTITVDVEVMREPPAVRPRGYLPTWPSSLPEPEKSNYSFALPEQVLHGNIENAGDNGTRRRFTDRLIVYNVRWVLDLAQFATFQNFLRNDIAWGNASFLAPFANGMGYNLVKAKFIGPPITTLMGAAWIVTGQLETTSAPIMSELVYRLGGRLRFDDSISLTDNLDLFWTGGNRISDSIFLADQMAQIKRPQDSFSFIEALSIRPRKGLVDIVTLLEALSTRFFRPHQDTLTLTELIRLKHGKRQSDSITLTDLVSIVKTFNPKLTDSVGFLDDELTIKITVQRAFDDYIDLSDSGLACYQNYAGYDYFAEAYVETCSSWYNPSDNIQLEENISWNLGRQLEATIDLLEQLSIKVKIGPISEAVELSDSITVSAYRVTSVSDELNLNATGNVRISDFTGYDYFAEDYTGTYIPFLN